jgi:outer membrane protein insertion porin family
MGYLGNYNSEIGPSPFERFVLGGDGLSNLNFNLAGQEIIAQRGGYDPYAPPGGATIFNKHIVELRYPFSTNPSAFIYGHIFAEAANQWLRVRDFNPFKLNRSVGAGMRFLLPAFGLLGFDYGIPFDLHQVFPGTPKATTLRELFSRGKITIVLGFEPE